MNTFNGYERPVVSIHQIEITSRCNLACVYCPHPSLAREKHDMSMETYRRSLYWVEYFKCKGTQNELSLTGMGEALLHPDFVEMLAMARHTLPHGKILFSTNGLLLDDAMAKAIKPYAPDVYISLHRPEKAGLAVECARRAGLTFETNAQFAYNGFDWAGQVDWANSAPEHLCQTLNKGWAVVLADGSVTQCCMDANGIGATGHVKQDPARYPLMMREFELCNKCHLQVPVTDLEEAQCASL
jgi:organic radical activating enzyme